MPESDRLPVNLAPIIRRANAATPGPWWAWDRGVGWYIAVGTETRDQYGRPERLLLAGDRTDIGRGEDAEFIAHARTDVVNLAAEVEELRDVLARVRAVLADWSGPRRHMSASHPMAELLDRLNEAMSEPAPRKTEGEGN